MQALSALRKILDEPPSIGCDVKEVNAELVVDSKCILGECVVYDDASNSVWWTDIEDKALYELSLDGEGLSVTKRTYDKMVGAFGLTDKPNHFLMAFEDGFQLMNVNGNASVSEYSKGPQVNPAGLPTRLNDGRCDRSGKRFICGGYYGSLPNKTVSVFAVEKQGDGLRHQTLIDKVRTTNSLCFSPDGNTMYFCDSPTKIIQAYDYKEGKLNSGPRAVYEWKEVGDPDGSTVDSEGYIWNTIWRKGAGPGRVQRINPATGQVDFVVHMPDSTSQCTCCCFGGADLDVLFVSTAHIDRDQEIEPQAGGIYAVKLPFKGIRENRFLL